MGTSSNRPNVPYDQSILDEQKIRDYAKKVARELIRKFNAEDRWVERQITQEVWEDETVTEDRWFGLRQVQVTRRVKKPRTTTRRVKADPPTSWFLGLGPSSTRRNRLQKRGDYGEESHRTSYSLRANGDLMRSYSYNYDGILDGRYFQGTSTEEETSMSASDMLWFDAGRGGRIWAPAKGVGLHARLTKLRNTGQ